MEKKSMSKKKILKDSCSLNIHPEKVTDALFLENPFFDPEDKVQVKYEMLRANKVEDKKVTHICHQYGYSRDAFYVIFRNFQAKGLVGLFDNSKQKKSTILSRQQIVNFIIQTKVENPSISGAELARRINEKFDTTYKKRAIEKAVKALGLSKKKLNY